MQHFMLDLPRAALTLGGFSVYWYGILFGAGILLALKYFAFKSSTILAAGLTELQRQQFDFYMLVGVLLGGRLGQFLFYTPELLLNHPLELFNVRAGGMSSHGGMLGVLLATIWFSRAQKTSALRLLDLISLCAPIGFFFGRLGNFVNAEMPGSVTDVAWAIIRPTVDALARHPVQLYQAIAEGPVLFLILRAVSKRTSLPGSLLGAFCLSYAVLRWFTESFRAIDPVELGYHFGITNGQWYSLAMVTIGVGVLWLAWRKPSMPEPLPG